MAEETDKEGVGKKCGGKEKKIKVRKGQRDRIKGVND
jgi:hypothetical protein